MSRDKKYIYRRAGEIHAANINQGFLATLGSGFLALLYQAIDEAPDSTLIVAQENDDVVGFVAGGTGMGAIYRQLLRRPLALLVALLPALLNPARLWRIIEILRYSGGDNDGLANMPCAELLSIAVDPQFRGKGHAEQLYLQLVEYFTGRGEKAFRIVVGEVLLPAHKFYRRMGAVPVAEMEVHKGASSTIYVHELSGSRPGGK
ncbi:MAG TPA: GNAT family N-acetyltransferase [Pseudomonadales bacterium]|nr:GNAT family N-acetyltransferase [Pseudomonadales bacterium]